MNNISVTQFLAKIEIQLENNQENFFQQLARLTQKRASAEQERLAQERAEHHKKTKSQQKQEYEHNNSIFDSAAYDENFARNIYEEEEKLF